MSLVGRTLGDFLLKQRIGVGGGGEVFLAVQATLEREAVVKVKLGRGARDLQATESFLREARIASTLDHPFAGHIYDFGSEADGTLWIAMELVRGEPLSQMIAQQGAIPLVQLVPLLDRIGEVLHTAHQQGIVHRDIKPHNIMVIGRAGRLLPKLLDFGIASAGLNDAVAPGEMTQKVGVIGTPHYMPPEQWRKKSAVDARTDIYSLGISIYEALTGKTPFADAATLFVLAEAHAFKPMPPLPDTLPSALGEVLARATAKKADDRYATVLEFVAAFRAASGLDLEPLPLPQLDRAVLENMTAEAPQPVAEAVALVEGARSLKQQLAAVHTIRRVAYRYLALVALAGRVRVGPGAARDAPRVRTLIEQMASGSLSDAQWRELALELTAPFAFRRRIHPLPELVAYFHADDSPSPLSTGDALALKLSELLDFPHDDSDEALHTLLVKVMPALGALLQRLSFLLPYALVVQQEGPDRWMGTRRQQRITQSPLTELLQADQPSLVDWTGRVVLTLYPFVQCFAPSGGMPSELFLLEGAGRHGAKLVALPGPFERQSDEVWRVLAAHGLDVDDAQARAHENDKPPYMGLATFTAADSDNFFGREREAQAFANRLHTVPFLTVVGPSGAGKSSFVLAGVLPILPGHWKSVVMRPGEAPLATLAARMLQAGLPFSDDGSWVERLPPDLSLFLVVDQFEELVTLCADAQQRQAFATTLLEAAARSKGRVRVAVTLRDDFLIRIQQIPAFRDRLSSSLQLLSTPAEDDLLRVVIEPAARAGYSFDDPDLPKHMVHAVLDNPGALALLSFTASQLWELRDRHLLHLQSKTYAALGGVGGALAHHAEQTMLRMAPEEQALVREVFRRLVTADGTRAVLSKQELREVLGKSAAGDRVIDQLVSARLLVTSETADGDQIEVIHEALLRSWPRLVEWQREDSEIARLRDALRTSAQQWRERGKARGLLWRTEALNEYKVWRARFSGRMTENEEAFARASLADETRTRRIRQALAGTAFAGLCVALVIIFNAYRKASANAEESRQRYVTMREEQTRLSLLDNKPLEALAYLDDAIAFGANGATVSQMGGLIEWLLRGRKGIVASKNEPIAAFAYDAVHDRGATFWSAAGGVVWSLNDALDGSSYGARVRALKLAEGCFTANFVDAGKRVASLCHDRSLKIFEVASGAVTREVRFGDDEPLTAGVGPTPDELSIAISNRGAYRVNTTTGEKKLLIPMKGVTEFSVVATSKHGGAAAAYLGLYDVEADSFKGFVLASEQAARSKAWAASTLFVPTSFPIIQASFDASGESLLVATQDGAVGVYAVAEKRWRWFKHAHAGMTAVLALSLNDSNQFLTAGHDGWVRIWNLASGDEINSVQFSGAPTSAAWGVAHGRPAVLVGDEHGDTYLIDVETGHVSWKYEGSEGFILGSAFAIGSTLAATASRGGVVRMWDTSQQYARLIATDSPILEMNFESAAGNGVLVATSHALQRVSFSGQSTKTIRSYDHAKNQQLFATPFSNGTVLLNGNHLSVMPDQGPSDELDLPLQLEGGLVVNATGDTVAAKNGATDITVLKLNHSAFPSVTTLHVDNDVLTLGAFLGQANFVSCSESGVLRNWALPSGAPAGTVKAHNAVCRVSMLEDQLRTFSIDGHWRTWISRTDQTLLPEVDGRVPKTVAGMAKDGKLVATRLGEAVLLQRDGQPLWRISLSHRSIQATTASESSVGLCAGGVGFVLSEPGALPRDSIHDLERDFGQYFFNGGALEAKEARTIGGLPID